MNVSPVQYEEAGHAVHTRLVVEVHAVVSYFEAGQTAVHEAKEAVPPRQ